MYVNYKVSNRGRARAHALNHAPREQVTRTGFQAAWDIDEYRARIRQACYRPLDGLTGEALSRPATPEEEHG